MAAPIRFLSGRNQQQKIGIEGSTDNQKVLEVVGRVGIGTTIFEPTSEFEVRGDVKIIGILTASNIDVSTGEVNFSQLNVSGLSTFTGAADFNGSIDVDGHTELDDVNVSGVSTFVGLGTFKNDLYVSDNLYVSGFVTATRLYSSVFGEFTGSTVSADNLVGSALSISGLSTFTGTADFNGSIDVDGQTELDDLNVSGVSTFAGAIDANGNLDVDGQTELDDVNVSGVSTFTGAADFNGSIDVDGHTELDNVNVSGAITATTFTGNLAGTVNTAAQTNITSLGTLSALTVSGDITANGNIAGDNSTNITGIAGVTATTLSGTLQTAAQTNITSVGTLSALTVSGDITANGNIAGDNSTNITGIAGVTATTLSGTLQTAAQTNITSVGTLTGLDINGHSELDDVNVSGAITATTFTGNLTGNAGTATSISNSRNFSISGDVVASTVSFDGTDNVVLAATIQPNSVTLAADTTGDFVQSITGTSNEVTVSVTSGENSTPQIGLPNDVTIGQDLIVTRNISVGGVSTFTGAADFNGSIDIDGHTELDNVNVSGALTAISLNVTNKLTTTGLGISIANGAGRTAYIEGPAEIWIDPSPTGAGTTSGIVRIRGDLYVDGTEFIVDVDKIELGDFNIGIASTVTSNSLLDGAGLGIGATSIRKFITWNNATSALMSSENWNLASGKHYEIAGTDVLTSDTLGSGVVNSSLTSVGTLGALTVSGNVNANGNIIGDSATNISGINIVTATSFTGSGANLTGITASQIGALRGITIKEEGSIIGTASSVSSINFVSSNLTATASGVGATVTLTDTPTFSSLNVTGITTIPNISGLTTFASEVNVGTGITLDPTSGIISATAFYGSGENLSDLINQRIAGLQIFDEGVAVGTGFTFAAIDVVGNNVSVSAVGLGSTARITVSDTPTFDTVAVTNNITANGNIVGDNSTNITGINQITANTFNGSLSGTATLVTVADESSDTTCFPLFATGATGDLAPKSGSNLTFNSADGTLTATDFNTTSDENLKDNIRTIEDPLAKVVEIRGVNFDWKETQKPSVGVIAQEVEKVFPELVANGEKKTVNYNGLIGLLIEVVKEQQTQINSLNERLSKLE
jgi:hypothetical protein